MFSVNVIFEEFQLVDFIYLELHMIPCIFSGFHYFAHCLSIMYLFDFMHQMYMASEFCQFFTVASSFTCSLMRSFVPFAGFFPMPSELEGLRTTATKSFRLCSLCNEKYEQETSGVLKGGVSTDSIADWQSVNLPSWLKVAECETMKRSLTEEVCQSLKF